MGVPGDFIVPDRRGVKIVILPQGKVAGVGEVVPDADRIVAGDRAPDIVHIEQAGIVDHAVKEGDGNNAVVILQATADGIVPVEIRGGIQSGEKLTDLRPGVR